MPKTLKVKLDLRDSADFRLVVPTRRKYVVAGTDAVYTVQSDSLTGYVDDVDLSTSGLPTGASATIGTDPIGNDGQTDITVETTGTSAGTYEFLIGGDVWTPPGDVYPAASCSLADVQAAINAASPGDTVRVPAGSGSATWAGQLVFTKGVLVIGPGKDNLTITSNYNVGYGDVFDPTYYLIKYEVTDPADNDPFRLSGFTFNLDNKCHFLYLRNNSMTAVTKFRVDHNYVDTPVVGGSGGVHAGMGIMVRGTIYGVEDNNTWIRCYFRHYNHDNAWSNITYELGSSKAFFHEDNDYALSNDQHFMYAEAGTSYVLRYSSIVHTDFSLSYICDMHGNQTGGNSATMGAECYENDITCLNSTLMSVRGGKAVCFNNRITSGGYNQIRVTEEYLDSGGPGAANNTISGQPQHASDAYFWGNTQGGELLALDNMNVQSTLYYSDLGRNVPTWGYDCWRHAVPFTGGLGEVGVGLLSARPSSGLTVGCGYWATDTSTLYRATSATTWEVFYTPYTYPHPHRSDPILGD